MKKYNYSEIEKIGYRPFIRLMVKELNDNNIKPRAYTEFLYDEDDPEASFMGGIVENYNAVEFLKEIGLLNNGICPMCGRRPIDGKYTFTSGSNRDIKFSICKGCYRIGNQNSLNPDNKEGCFIATLCYGDYNSKEVIMFRNYRDTYLNKSFIGRIFIITYYLISPMIVRIIANHDFLIQFIKNYFLQKIYISLERRSKR